MPALITTLKLRACLRVRPSLCITPDGTRGLMLAVRDVAGMFYDCVLAQWIGPEALEFLQRHEAELVPGRCVDLELTHIRAGREELRARISACTLAPLPLSWAKAWPTAPHSSTTNPENTTA